MEPQPNPPKPRRRRRIRVLPILGYVIVAFGLAWFLEVRLPTTVILVRHAETDGTMANDTNPPLNAAGRARAEKLADVIEDIDVLAGVDAIYASPLRRTQQTAEPLAKRLGLDIEIDDPYESERFIRELLREHKGKIVLVVSHSDIIAELIDELHGHQSVPPIGPDEYDNLYVVTMPRYGGVKTLRLHYGEPPSALGASNGVPTTFTSP